MNIKLALGALTIAGALFFGQLLPPAGQAQEAAVITGKVTPQASEAPRRTVQKVSPVPRRFTVPTGNHYVLTPGPRPTLGLLAPGQILEETHCVQVNCPPGMASDTTCWNCYEITSE
jgi:hypothetical protein